MVVGLSNVGRLVGLEMEEEDSPSSLVGAERFLPFGRYGEGRKGEGERGEDSRMKLTSHSSRSLPRLSVSCSIVLQVTESLAEAWEQG